MLIPKTWNIGALGRSKAKKKKTSDTSQPAPKRTDSVTLSKPRRFGRLKRTLRRALLATTLLANLAGPIAAQANPGGGYLMATSIPQTELVQPAPEQCCQQSDTAEFSFRTSFINDNGPMFMSDALGSPGNTMPDGRYADDDGWTAELRLESTFTRGNRETFAGARLMMLTETGSWNRNAPGSDYQGLRTDIGEVVVQQNFRQQLNDNTTLDLGVGGGIQAIGNLGGESVQRWWHQAGPFGGRTGSALQGTQTSESFRAMPLLTAGARLSHEVSHGVSFNLGAQTSVPVGNGVGFAGLTASTQGQLGPLQVEVGGMLDAGWSSAQETAFHEISGVRPGAFARMELDAGKIGGVFTQVQTGGMRGEPILTVGLNIGIGGPARINPFW